MGQGQSTPRTGPGDEQQGRRRAARRSAAPRGAAGGGAAVPPRQAAGRFSPYNLLSSRATAAGRGAGQPTPVPAAAEADAIRERMSIDSIVPADVREAGPAPVQGLGDRQAAAESQDSGHRGTHTESDSAQAAETAQHDRWQVSRVRMRAGNQLLARIIGQSVISSVSQELERRNAVIDRLRLGSTAVAAADPSERNLLPEHRLPHYTMRPTSRFELFFRISAYLQSLLEVGAEAGLEGATGGDSPGSRTGTSGGNSAESDGNSTPEGNPERDPERNPERDSEAPSSAAPSAQTNDATYRIFLLPDAIEQALESYDHAHGSPRQEEESNNDAGGSAAGHAPESSESARVREMSDDERQRAEQQRSREEKLQRLRNIAQAMRDERRGVEFPVMMLGVRLNPEVYRQAHAAVDSMADRPIGSDSPVSLTPAAAAATADGSGSTSSSSLVAEPSAIATQDLPTSPPSPAGAASETPSRGILNRVGSLVPNLIEYVSSLRRVRDGAAAATPGGSASDGPAHPPSAGQNSTAPSPLATAAAAEAGGEQPGLSVFIMINYMSLANPIVLPLVTHTLFPELLGDAAPGHPGNVEADLASGNNYDLFLEIASIVGQVATTTVSQGIVDKTLREYRYEGPDEGAPDSVVARYVADNGTTETVQLVSANRCPVCLEGFEVGDVLRVLACRHGLHKMCGDSWFTQGANRCPICRVEAVTASSAPAHA